MSRSTTTGTGNSPSPPTTHPPPNGLYSIFVGPPFCHDHGVGMWSGGGGGLRFFVRCCDVPFPFPVLFPVPVALQGLMTTFSDAAVCSHLRPTQRSRFLIASAASLVSLASPHPSAAGTAAAEAAAFASIELG